MSDLSLSLSAFFLAQSAAWSHRDQEVDFWSFIPSNETDCSSQIK